MLNDRTQLIKELEELRTRLLGIGEYSAAAYVGMASVALCSDEQEDVGPCESEPS